MPVYIYASYDRCVYLLPPFLGQLGITLVNLCQSPSKPRHRNGLGDDESIFHKN